jgi:hypothetical protein
MAGRLSTRNLIASRGYRTACAGVIPSPVFAAVVVPLADRRCREYKARAVMLRRASANRRTDPLVRSSVDGPAGDGR